MSEIYHNMENIQAVTTAGVSRLFLSSSLSLPLKNAPVRPCFCCDSHPNSAGNLRINCGPLSLITQFFYRCSGSFLCSTPGVFWTPLCMFRWISCSTFLQIFSSLLPQYLTETDESFASKNVRCQESFSPPPPQKISPIVTVKATGA